MVSRRSIRSAFVAAALAVASVPAQAQEAPQAPPKLTPEQQAEMDAYTKAGTPGEPHRRLAESAGKYAADVRSWWEPGGAPNEEKGTATRTMALDGRVLVEHFEGSMMGGQFTGHGMTGFDNVTGQYWSTWNDSMSTGLMVSHGTCDANHACEFRGTWNDPIRKGPVENRTTLRWPDADTEVMEMYGPDRQGKEFKMMEITYRRQK